MISAVLAALISVALGASIAFVPRIRGGVLGRVRTFALIAAITVVFGHLLPESAEALGPLALALVMLGVVLPTWIESAMARLAGDHDHDHHHHGEGGIGLELGYFALLMHHVGDGVALYQYGASPSASLDVVLALAAHTVPVIAVLVLRYTLVRGRRAALLRAAGLLAATIAGTLGGALFPAVLEALSPWIAALVSGLLLHVIAHDLEADPPESTFAKTIDLSAAGLGVALPLWTSARVEHGFAGAFFELLFRCAPFLLFGLAATALLGALLEPRRSSLSRALFTSPRGSLRAAAELRACGARPRLIALAAIGAPILRVEVALLAVALLGLARASLLFAAALAGAVLVGLVIERRSSGLSGPPLAEAPLDLLARFDAQLHHAVPWLLAGALAAVYANTGAPALAHLSMVAALGTLAIALPAYLAAVALIPLAAALTASGVSFAPVLAGLLLGPMLHVGSIGFLARAFGRSASLLATVLLVAVAAAAAFFAPSFGAPAVESFRVPLLETASLAILGLFVLRALWKMGPRGFIAGLAILQPQ